jgi:hypothetical protein
MSACGTTSLVTPASFPGTIERDDGRSHPASKTSKLKVVSATKRLGVPQESEYVSSPTTVFRRLATPRLTSIPLAFPLGNAESASDEPHLNRVDDWRSKESCGLFAKHQRLRSPQNRRGAYSVHPRLGWRAKIIRSLVSTSVCNDDLQARRHADVGAAAERSTPMPLKDHR